MNIVLIGYRGSGKSSIGRKLAEVLGREFVDTDPLIEKRAGRTIPEIFAAEGEVGFRRWEGEVIREVSKRDGLVIAAGGGAVLRAENVDWLKGNGKVVWLHAEPGTLHARILADKVNVRPNLTAEGGLREVERMLEQRRKLYEAAADARVDVDALGVEEAVRRVAALCGSDIG